jgi:hypothetical protein
MATGKDKVVEALVGASTEAREARSAEADGRGRGPRRRIIRPGSREHRTFLGIDAPGVTPERRKDLEAALAATDLESNIQPEAVRKTTITPDNYAASDRYGPGDDIFDGWHRKGDQG